MIEAGNFEGLCMVFAIVLSGSVVLSRSFFCMIVVIVAVQSVFCIKFFMFQAPIVV